jgi:hypothetical protein
MSGRFFRNLEISENPEIRKCPRELGNPQGIQGFSGFQLHSECVRVEIPAILGCFRRQFPDFRKENVRTVSLRDEIFPRIPRNPGVFEVFVFHGCRLIKCIKISRFWVFSGTDFPISEIPEFRKSGTHFVHFRISGIREIPTLKNPVFTTALRSRYQGDFEIQRFRGFQEISGTLHKLTKKNFGKTGNSDLTLLHFFFAFRVSRVQRCEKSETKTPK